MLKVHDFTILLMVNGHRMVSQPLVSFLELLTSALLYLTSGDACHSGSFAKKTSVTDSFALR